MQATFGRRAPLRLPRPAPAGVAAVLSVAAVGLVAFVVAYLMEYGSYDAWAAVLVAIGLVSISVPMLRRAARYEADPRIATLLWWALGLKLLASMARYIVAFGLYDGQADAAAYSRVGAELARQFRHGEFVVDLGKRVQGTGFIEILTGAVFSVTGATTIGGFLVFSWLGFWGLYLFHRAFVRACPEGDHWRYALLVFLLPSLLFWPSSIGKEAWMCLFLGVVAYGAARLFTHARGGLLLIAVGALGLGMVRPHVAALVGLAVLLGMLTRRPPKDASIFAPLAKLTVLLVLGLGMVYAVAQLETFFGVDDFNAEAIQTTLDEVTRTTGQAGSAFATPASTDLNPARFPQAFADVMFRPLPWQAENAQALIASAESLVVLVLFVLSWRRIVGALRAVLRTPYVVTVVTYTVLFVFAFSAFSNAGILVRQRVQLLPFVLVLICVPPLRRGQRVRELLSGPRGSTLKPDTSIEADVRPLA